MRGTGDPGELSRGTGGDVIPRRLAGASAESVGQGSIREVILATFGEWREQG